MPKTVAVLTGDLIESSSLPAKQWLAELKRALGHWGAENADWEVYRGDSFQLRIKPEEALLSALSIKAHMRVMRPLDVRICIGLGEESMRAKRVSESNGVAYSLSGQCLENLHRATLRIAGNRAWHTGINLMLDLAMLTANAWTPVVAQDIQTTLQYPGENQKQLAQRLGKSQSNVSASLKRGGFDEIMRLEGYYRSTWKQAL